MPPCAALSVWNICRWNAVRCTTRLNGMMSVPNRHKLFRLDKLSSRLLMSCRIAATMPSIWTNIPSQFDKRYWHFNLPCFDSRAISFKLSSHIDNRDCNCISYTVSDALHMILSYPLVGLYGCEKSPSLLKSGKSITLSPKNDWASYAKPKNGYPRACSDTPMRQLSEDF